MSPTLPEMLAHRLDGDIEIVNLKCIQASSQFSAPPILSQMAIPPAAFGKLPTKRIIDVFGRLESTTNSV